jgi:hypothetical protein
VARRVAELYAHMADLHKDSLAGIATAQNYTEEVEDQMHKQDAELLSQIQTLVGQADQLDRRESSHYDELTQKQTSQESLEAADKSELVTKIDSDVSQARQDLFSQMSRDREELHDRLQKGMKNISDTTEALREEAKSRDMQLEAQIANMIRLQEANNTGQEEFITLIRNNTATFERIALGRLGNLDTGLATANHNLEESHAQLHKQIDDNEKSLTSRLNAGISELSGRADTMRKNMEDSVTRLNNGLEETNNDLTSSKAAWQTQRDADVAMLKSKIDGSVRDLDSRLMQATAAQNESLTSALSQGMTQAAKELSDLVSQLTTRRTQIAGELSQFKSMQLSDNDDQTRKIDALKHDADAQNQATQTLLAALEKNLGDTNARLQQARKDLSEALQEQEKRLDLSLRNKIARLEESSQQKISEQGGDLDQKLHQGLQTLSTSVSSLSSSADAVHSTSMKKMSDATEAQEAETAKQAQTIDALKSASDSEREAAGKRADAIKAILARTEQNLDSAKAAIQAQRNDDVSDLSAKISSSVRDTDQALTGALSANEATMRKNITGEVARLRGATDAARDLVKSQGKSIGDKLVQDKENQKEIDTKQDEDLSDMRDKFHRDTTALEGRVAALRAEIANQNTALKYAEADIKKIQTENKRALSGKIDSDIASMTSSIGQAVSTAESQARSRLSKGVETISDKVRDLALLSNTTTDAIRDALNALIHKQAGDEAASAQALNTVRSNAASDTAQTDTSINNLDGQLTHTQQTLQADTLQVSRELERGRLGLEAHMNASMAATQNALKAQLATDKDEIRQRLSDDLLTMNQRLNQLRTDTATTSAELGTQISNARTAEMNHDQQQMGLLTSIKSEQTRDKQTLDALVNQMQADLAQAKSELEAAKSSIAQREQLDFEESNGKIDRGLVALSANVTGLLHEEMAKTRDQLKTIKDAITTRFNALSGKTDADTTLLSNKVKTMENRLSSDSAGASKEIDDIRSRSESDKQQTHHDIYMLDAQLNETSAQLVAVKANLLASQNTQQQDLSTRLTQAISALQGALDALTTKTDQSVHSLTSALDNARTSLAAAQTSIKSQQTEDRQRMSADLQAGLQVLYVYVRVCMHGYLCMCMYVYAYIRICLRMCVCVCLCVYMYVCICIYIYYMFVCLFDQCLCVYMYVCICIYILYVCLFV